MWTGRSGVGDFQITNSYSGSGISKSIFANHSEDRVRVKTYNYDTNFVHFGVGLGVFTLTPSSS